MKFVFPMIIDDRNHASIGYFREALRSLADSRIHRLSNEEVQA